MKVVSRSCKNRIIILLAFVFIIAQIQTAFGAVQFQWPTPGSTGIYQGFGNGHQGLDIAADAGVNIYASAAGTVEVVYTGCKNFDGAKKGTPCNTLGICNPSKSFYKDGFCNSAYGNAVMIKHDDGTWTSYAHMTQVASGIAVGKRVSAGQLLGIAGSTGRSYGAHLHFEMRKGDGSGEMFWLAKPFDPLTKVKATGSASVSREPVKKLEFTYFEGIGDVNDDGVLDATDALFVLQSVVRMRSLDEEQQKRADVDRNGNADTEDALHILKITVNMAVIIDPA